MADPAEEPRPEIELGEDGGGPVKSFLEHLEDLRWVLIKSATAIGIAMIVCLLAVNQLVSVLKWPLERARHLDALFAKRAHSQDVTVYFGTNKLASFRAPTNFLGSFSLGTNSAVVLEFVPIQLGEHHVLELRSVTNRVVANEGRGPGLIFLDPAAPFFSSLYISFFGGLLIAAPLVFYYVGTFVFPALKRVEKKYFSRALVVGIGLFMVGVAFCYFGIMPFALRAAEAYSNWMGVRMPDWRAETYFSFVTKFMLGMGLGFELPVVLLALVKIGILDYKKLSGMRRYMIVINLILGAVLTTPEPLTQVLMAVPLQILYEVAVWVAWYWERQEKKRAAAAEASPATQ